MRQRGDDAQRLGRGVENGRQPRAAFVVLLLAKRPGLVSTMYLSTAANQCPGRFQRARKLALLELRIEFRDRLARRFSNGLIVSRAVAARDGYGTSPLK